MEIKPARSMSGCRAHLRKRMRIALKADKAIEELSLIAGEQEAAPLIARTAPFWRSRWAGAVRCWRTR